MGNGFSHVGVSTLNMEATIYFYENVLGMPCVLDNLTRIKQGGTLRQIYIDVGDGQFIVFMEPKSIPGISEEYDTGINRALGLPKGMYHIALKVRSLDELEQRRKMLERHNILVSSIIDLEIAKSIFFCDPNGLQLEFCCHTRVFNESDLHQKSEASIALPD